MSSTTSSNTTSSIKPTVSYTLYMYRQELKRREARYLCLNKTKVALTTELISKNVRNCKYCTTENLKAITREILFKKKLKKQIVRIKKLENLGIENANPNAQTTKL